MKKIRRNIRTGFFILLGLFLFLLGYFCYGILFYGDRWFANSYNVRVRLNQVEPDIIPGDILDRKGTVLATTAKKTIKGENGEELEYYYRTYHKDARATAHVVGFHNPQYGRLGAEAFHIRYLMGYNNNFLERIYQKAFLPRENGNNIQLTVDLDLQRYISEKLGNRKGKIGRAHV